MDERIEQLSGWGRALSSTAHLVRPDAVGELGELLAGASAGAIPRGCGRSYGDAAQLAGGRVIDMTALRKVLAFDGEGGVISAEAGVTLRELQRLLVPLGWSVPVVPGTQVVTLGGAIAADIHGKNHEYDGSFGRHVRSIRLRLANGDTRDCAAPDDELLLATMGGMGLTGVIESATISLERVQGPWMRVDTERTHTLEHTLERLIEHEGPRRRFTVAWIDALAEGAALGRGIVTKGERAMVSGARRAGLPELPVPRHVAPTLLRPSTVRAFNELNWRHAPRRRVDELIDAERFLYPLDVARDWNRLYGAAGFYQYQFVVPLREVTVLRATLEQLARDRVPVYLAILKRFGDGDAGLLSFPMAGWTLALDLPAAAAGARAAMDRLDELVLAAGGRVYLAKDARLPAAHLPAMYPQLDRWREIRARYDPTGVISSDLGRRLGLSP
jgi:decaprenylphospho-beta-D-ribofuranose 2-oxidase